MRTRSCDAAMFMASRYFATVRRATGTPVAFSKSASLASDSGLRGFSASMSLRIIDWMAVLEASQQLEAANAEGDAQKIRTALEALEALLRAAREHAEGGLGARLSRIHGDFHLGQVLVAQGDAFLIDFEGEPSRPVEERRRKSSPLRDVAGLLHSLDYVVGAMRQGPDHVAGPAQERRDQLLERFREASTTGFLDAYGAAIQEPDAGEPDRPVIDFTLLDLFLLEKAAYEVNYEAANRPAWLRIPLAGLARVARRVLHAEPPAHAAENSTGGPP